MLSTERLVLRPVTADDHAALLAHWTQPDERAPVGLILCTEQDEALARYALDGLNNKMLVREYLTALPPESELAQEINRARAVLIRQAEVRRLAGRK